MTHHPFKRKILKWYKKLMYRLLYFTFVNSHTLLSMKRADAGREDSVYSFLKELAFEYANNAGVEKISVPTNSSARLIVNILCRIYWQQRAGRIQHAAAWFAHPRANAKKLAIGTRYTRRLCALRHV